MIRAWFSRKSLVLYLCLASLLWPRLAAADCTLTSIGRTPLPDLGPGSYLGSQGGLYPAGANNPPPVHEADALSIAQNQILPRNSAGAVDLANGRIVMISVGMSNTTQEFSVFLGDANADPSKNPRLTIVDGAQGGRPVTDWTDPQASTWSTVDSRLAAAGVTPQQVQVAWVKQAYRQPSTFGAFPAHAQSLRDDFKKVARNLLTRYPNIKIAYFSSRTRAYTNDPAGLNPEPFSYESGFSVKWMIEDQINGAADLNYKASAGPVVAPLLLWGPYLWADGTVPRSDGFTWLCSDTTSDFTHPSTSGRQKVADQLLAFFKTHATATPWFLRSTVTGQPPTFTSTSATPASGSAPLTVNFSASAQDPDGAIEGFVWTFDDGTFSLAQNPTKSFPAPGSYDARVTATDTSGNPVTATVPVAVSGSGGGGGGTEFFPADADAAVASASPNSNFGASTLLKVQGSGSAPSRISYLKFTVVGSSPIVSASLHLEVADPGSAVEVLTASNTSWQESTITWNNRPAIDGPVVATFTPSAAGAVTIDVTSAITGPGAVTLVLRSNGTNNSDYRSREHSNPDLRPELEVRFQ